MKSLFMEGGPVGMFFVTLFGAMAIVMIVSVLMNLKGEKGLSPRKMDTILFFGSLSLIAGILWQVIGLFQAFGAIQMAGDISPTLIAAGVRVSMIAPLWGLILFFVSYISWYTLRMIARN